ncbi:MAG TPA: relaxase/mobilization nuclease domain-containing protein [Longimicrobiaceae bacterium]|nr:relaxase/mobilization nuclease domain-containing protein [Longimicrobiaceae bacterium]
MIGKLTLGKSFKCCGEYMLMGKDRVHPDQRVSWMECHNLPTERMEVAVRLMAATSRRSRRTQLPVLQLSVSFAPGDPVDSAMIKRVLQRTLRDVGLGEHQAVLLEHHDTAVPHGHAIVNRVHPETGRAWKGSFSKTRIEASLRRQEQEEGLRVVPGWLAPVPDAPELKPRPRLARADQEFLREVKERAGPVLEKAQFWSEAEAGLAEFGLRVRVNGRGMSVTDGQREVKASEIGRQVSRFQLEKRFGRYSDYRLRRAVASEIMGQARTNAPSDLGRMRAAATHPASQLAAEPRERFSLYEEDGIFGVWDSVGPNMFFAETRERAEAEMQRANRLVARYPNIGVVRCLRDMDGEWRDARGLPRLPEEKGRPLHRRTLPTRSESSSPQVTGDHARTVGPPSHATPPPAQAPGKQQDAPPTQRASFLSEVKEKARPVLRLADSWADLEHGLGELGLSLRVKGGGFVVTDGQWEVKASEIGREFSRSHLEKRLGHYPQPGAAMPPLTAPAPESPRVPEPLSAPEAPPQAEAVREEVAAPAPAGTQPRFAELDDIRARIERLRRRSSRRPEHEGRRTRSAAGETLPGSRAPDAAKAGTLPHSDKLVREDVVGDHGFVSSGGSPEAEAFLRMANHSLEHTALQKEIDEALATRDEAERLKFGLDREDAHLRGARISFDRAVKDTFVDPEVFWSAFKPLDDQRKFKMLERLRDAPAAFAHELAARHPSESTSGGRRSPGWLQKAAELLPGRNPTQRVFRPKIGIEGAGRLTAGAGERYVSAVRDHTRAYARAARSFGLPETAQPTDVREALSAHVESASARKERALAQCSALGQPSTADELLRAYSSLRPEDRQWVVRRLPGAVGLLQKAAGIAQELVEGPRRKGGGYTV